MNRYIENLPEWDIEQLEYLRDEAKVSLDAAYARKTN